MPANGSESQVADLAHVSPSNDPPALSNITALCHFVGYEQYSPVRARFVICGGVGVERAKDGHWYGLAVRFLSFADVSRTRQVRLGRVQVRVVALHSVSSNNQSMSSPVFLSTECFLGGRGCPCGRG